MCVYFKNTRPDTAQGVLHRQVGLLLQSGLHEAVSNLTLAINVEESTTPTITHGMNSFIPAYSK
jgi:hypothetical protein